MSDAYDYADADAIPSIKPIPPPDTQAMTREQIILVESGGQDAVNFAVAQAETIRRLEDLTTMQDGGIRGLHEQIKDKNAQIEHLQARLTASEAMVKEFDKIIGSRVKG